MSVAWATILTRLVSGQDLQGLQGFWTLDTLKKIPGQVRATGADPVFRQDEQDLQGFW